MRKAAVSGLQWCCRVQNPATVAVIQGSGSTASPVMTSRHPRGWYLDTAVALQKSPGGPQVKQSGVLLQQKQSEWLQPQIHLPRASHWQEQNPNCREMGGDVGFPSSAPAGSRSTFGVWSGCWEPVESTHHSWLVPLGSFQPFSYLANSSFFYLRNLLWCSLPYLHPYQIGYLFVSSHSSKLWPCHVCITPHCNSLVPSSTRLQAPWKHKLSRIRYRVGIWYIFVENKLLYYNISNSISSPVFVIPYSCELIPVYNECSINVNFLVFI